MSESFASLVRKVAEQHPTLADPKDLAPLLLDEIAGRETEVLTRLLPTAISRVLSRRQILEDERASWEAFLEERIPTPAGAKFARDAAAEDLEAGSERRRSFAGNLDRRAIQFDAVAARMRQLGAGTAGALDTRAGITLIRELEIRTSVLRRSRLRAEVNARRIAALRASRDTLAALLASGGSPVLEMLSRQRDDLTSYRDKLIAEIAKGREVEAEMEVLYGTG